MSWSTQRGSKLTNYGTRNSPARDLSTQRYIACDPDGVYPLPPSTKSDRKIYPDFVPWHESQEENDLTIENVPRGFLQRPQVANETASACASMLPLFKQWTSTPALSYFLARSMQSREKISRLAPGSTFKPPPRVTLTDQKREAWLKDLASPNVPLRRLSRTIPHGIRNKTLLEQCCMKHIPVSRAVWFARCVGANELRGLKRKGHNNTASDSAWIREWTDEVIDFFEKSIVSSTKTVSNDDQPQSLESKLSYQIRLVCSLFMESLMDQTTFLRWVIDFFRNCALICLPVAHMLVKLYWRFLIQSSFLSKQMTAALINRYSALTELSKKNEENATMASYLKDVGSMIKDLSRISPMCFVSPDLWQKIEPILSQIIDDDDDERMLEQLRKRNEALIAVGSLHPAVIRHQRPKAYMIRCLDTIKSPGDLKDITKTLLPLIKEDPRASLTTLFEWVCHRWTLHDSNVYIAAALCESWRKETSLNTSDILVDFLLQIDDSEPDIMDRVYCLMVEFLRIDALRISDYLRKSVSSGVLFLPRLKHRAEIQAKILRRIPESYTTASFMRQKNMFLQRAGNTEKEKEDVTAMRELLFRRLAFLYKNGAADPEEEPVNSYGEEDLTEEETSLLLHLRHDTKIEISEEIVTRLEQHMQNNYSLLMKHTTFIKRILVLLGDYRALYHSVWMILRGTENMSVIGLIAGMIDEYFMIFGALGQVEELVEIFVEKANSLAPKFKLARSVFSLSERALKELPTESQVWKDNLEKLLKLQNVNHVYDSAAPSPLSEGLLSDNGPNSPFASLRINEPTDARSLPKHFTAVSLQFWSMCENAVNFDEIRKFMMSLKLLRDIDPTVFDDLYNNWLRDLFSSGADEQTLSRILLFSVIYECTALKLILDLFSQKATDGVETAMLKNEKDGVVSKLLTGLYRTQEKMALNAIEKTVFEAQYSTFMADRPEVYLRSIWYEMYANEDSQLDDKQKQRLLEKTYSDHELFMDIVVRPIIRSESSSNMVHLQRILSSLLKNESELTHTSCDTNLSKTVECLSKSCNDFNLMLCQALMEISVAIYRSNVSLNDSEKVKQVAHELVNYVQQEDIRITFFGDILQGLNPEIRRGISIACQVLFLQSPDMPIVLQSNRNVTRILLEIICACGESTCDDLESDLDRCVSRLTRVNDDLGEEDQRSDNTEDLDVALMMIIKIIMMGIHGTDHTMDKVKARTWLRALYEAYSNVLQAHVKGALQDAINVANDVCGEEETAVQSKEYAKSYLSDLMIYNPTNGTFSDINVCSFDLLEDSNPTMAVNDVPLDLALFDAITERKNPP